MRWPASSIGRRQALPLRGYGAIVLAFVILLVIALAASWSAIRVVDSTRAYVNGEGRYSKAEKIAVLSLHRYAYSRNPHDYMRFLAAVSVPQGDHLARMGLQSSPIDVPAVRRGFALGQNNRADLDGMISLFRWFSWWQPFAAAVADWRQGDELVGELIAEGESLKNRINSGTLTSSLRQQSLDRIDSIDNRLTVLEDTFSAHLGVAAREATALIVVGLSALTLLLWAAGTGFAARLVKRQMTLDRHLASSEARFRDFADVASDWYWEMDADGLLTYVSERFSEVIARPMGEVLGQDGGAFVREHILTDAQRKIYLRAVDEHRAFRDVQLEYARDDGSTRYWSIAGKPHFDRQRRFLGYRGVGSDVTAAMRDARALEEAKNRAEVANRAKSEFLANMSHELRTPLNAILGFSEVIESLMLGREAIDRYVDYAHDIHSSGRHLLAIIDDILDLSKIEAGHIELDESDIGLDEIAHSLSRLLSDRFREGGIDFRLDIPDPAPILYVDERKFSQILINLLSNARKFTPEGGTVTLAARAQTNGGLLLTVRDTGIGIAAEDIPVVLSPFGQVESAFSRNHHGTGLGLPLAKSLTELHGGTLGLESEPGAGTLVSVRLPPERVVVATSSQRAGRTIQR